MKRRFFIKGSLGSIASIYLTACGQLKSSSSNTTSNKYFMSVLGPQPSLDMGFTLTHEHLVADLRPYSEQQKNPLSLDINEVVASVLPHLTEIQKLSCKTFIDCTAVGVGRNPPILKALAAATGMHIVTTTGAYLSNDSQFKPDYFDAMTANELAEKWIGEWRH